MAHTKFTSRFPSWLRRIYRSIFKIKPFSEVIVDDSGIPITVYRDIAGRQRNPVTISQFALKYHSKEEKEFFLNCANWLVDNLSHKGAFSVWEYKFPWRKYNVIAPWVSGMAQGLGIKTLVLAHKMTSEDKFLDAAYNALNAFKIPVEDGGVLRIDNKDQGWWYEEYASPNSMRSNVLNGHIFALEGLNELYQYTKNNKAKHLLQKGLQELKRHLHEYDTGSWTYYDRLGLVAPPRYHKLHVRQMRSLWEMTGDEFFLTYYRKWKEYMKSSSKTLLLLT